MGRRTESTEDQAVRFPGQAVAVIAKYLQDRLVVEIVLCGMTNFNARCQAVGNACLDHKHRIFTMPSYGETIEPASESYLQYVERP